MKIKQMMGKIKCYGSTTVGPRGQVVIPANARKEMGIESGDTILVFAAMGGHEGLLLVKTDTLEEMLKMLSDGLANFEKIVKDKGSEVTVTGDEE